MVPLAGIAGNLGLLMLMELALKGAGKGIAKLGAKKAAAKAAATATAATASKMAAESVGKLTAGQLARMQLESALGKTLSGDLPPQLVAESLNKKIAIDKLLKLKAQQAGTTIEDLLATKYGTPVIGAAKKGAVGKVAKAAGNAAATGAAVEAADKLSEKYKGASTADTVFYGGLWPFAAKIAQATGISIDAAMTMLGEYANRYKDTMLPADKEKIYGATPSSIAAASIGPAAKTLGTIANTTGNAVGSSVDNFARQMLMNKQVGNIQDMSTGALDLINGRERRAFDSMKQFAEGGLTDIPPVPKKSDERLKRITGDLNNKKGLRNLDDFLYLTAASCYKDVDIANDEYDYDDSVLDGYAKHIRNYAYNYNDKAKEIDPSIDTSVEHIGPMAQDIEKVIPSAVIEDESGYKKVDTARLALANAGAIGDLARENREMKQEINELKEGV